MHRCDLQVALSTGVRGTAHRRGRGPPTRRARRRRRGLSPSRTARARRGTRGRARGPTMRRSSIPRPRARRGTRRSRRPWCDRRGGGRGSSARYQVSSVTPGPAPGLAQSMRIVRPSAWRPRLPIFQSPCRNDAGSDSSASHERRRVVQQRDDDGCRTRRPVGEAGPAVAHDAGDGLGEAERGFALDDRGRELGVPVGERGEADGVGEIPRRRVERGQMLHEPEVHVERERERRPRAIERAHRRRAGGSPRRRRRGPHRRRRGRCSRA